MDINMKITFLGTGAADWELSEHKGLSGFRRNSSVLIDGTLLIDPGPHVLDAIETFGIDKDAIKYIINTHCHRDHYCGETVRALSAATFIPTPAGSTTVIGKYTVTSLVANHATCPGATHFIISDGEKRIFYGMDGAWLNYAEMQAIRNGGLDLAVLDGTVGNGLGDFRIFEHNDLSMVRNIKKSLSNDVRRWFINHMARTLHASHEELTEDMARDGIEVAFDGLTVEV